MKVIEYFKPSEFGAWIFMDLAQSSPEDGLSEKWLGGEGGGGGGKEGGMEGGGGWGNEGSKRCMNVLTIFN